MIDKTAYINVLKIETPSLKAPTPHVIPNPGTF